MYVCRVPRKDRARESPDEEYRDPGTFSFGIEFEFPAMGRSRMALRTIDNSYLLRRRRL
jgi:hypothetical protein